MIAFLRTVALAWQQQTVQHNAAEILKVARELNDRLKRYTEKLQAMGRGLHQAVRAYNDGVGTYQARVTVSARRLSELGAGDALAPVDTIDGPRGVVRGPEKSGPTGTGDGRNEAPPGPTG